MRMNHQHPNIPPRQSAVRGLAMVEPTELPSSQSVIACLRGHPGAIGKTILTTMLRTLLIMPGMWLAGGRGWRLWAGSSAASSTITLFLFFWYAAQERGRREMLEASPALAEPVLGNGTIIDGTVAEG